MFVFYSYLVFFDWWRFGLAVVWSEHQ